MFMRFSNSVVMQLIFASSMLFGLAAANGLPWFGGDAAGDGAVKPGGFLTRKTKELTTQQLLETVMGALTSGYGNSSQGDDGSLHDLSKIQDSLKPIIAASPKNAYGRLGDEAARYALHRLFMERHGWEIKGFGAVHGGNASQTSIFQHWVPPEVQAELEKSVRGRGFSILELSVFAATLEQLIAAELPRKLEDAYRAMGLPSDDSISRSQAESLIDLYMGAYIRAEDVTMLNPTELFKFQTSMSFMYNNWDETQKFFREIQESVVHGKETFTFADVAAVLEKVEANFVYWNDHQCQSLKENLMELEQELPGRVRMLDFYEAALYKGMYQFVEKISYLKALGAVDEAEPLEPRLILSNYIDGPSNCVARTSYYSVCCMDECADLYSHVEKQLGKPEATAAEIIAVVQGLSSATTCTILPDKLQQELHSHAGKNGGRVSLHGKAFAEWMHFVYPRECTWPQKFGPAHSQTMEEWEESTHIYPSADTRELLRYSEQLRDMEQVKRARDAKLNNKTAPQPTGHHHAAPPKVAIEQQIMHSAVAPFHVEPLQAMADDEPHMIGGSKKKKRLAPATAAGTMDAESSGVAMYWWLGPVAGALYGAALGVVKLLGFRSEDLLRKHTEASRAPSTCV
jgi:hypothetical protein